MAGLSYFIRRALSSLKRYASTSIMTVMVLSVVFGIFLSFLLFASNVSHLASNWSKGVRIYAFITENAHPDLPQQLTAQLRSRSEITDVVYISAEAALARFQSEFPEETDILASLQSNPFPASIEATVKSGHTDKKRLETISGELSKVEGVEEVVYGKELFEKLAVLRGLLFWGQIIVGFAITLACLFLMYSTIRYSIMLRRNEVGILELVGATPDFIRKPFVIEGIIKGFLGAFVAVIAVAILFRLGASAIEGELFSTFGVKGLQFLDLGTVFLVLLSGAVIGGAGSLLAIIRHESKTVEQ